MNRPDDTTICQNVAAVLRSRIEARQKNRLFFDVIYSSDDGGWYCTAFDKSGKDVDDTDIMLTKEEAIKAILKKYPNATLIKVID
jgi:hypothetical protein